MNYPSLIHLQDDVRAGRGSNNDKKMWSVLLIHLNTEFTSTPITLSQMSYPHLA